MMLAIAPHWTMLKVSPRKMSPDSAPSAGLALISTPKVRVGRRVSAYISSEYGNALESSAIAQAVGNSAGDRSAVPDCAIPMGMMTIAAASVPSAAV